MEITTFDKQIRSMLAAGLRPVALEALWDGDTNGLHLCLNLYAEKKSFFRKELMCYDLGIAITSSYKK